MSAVRASVVIRGGAGLFSSASAVEVNVSAPVLAVTSSSEADAASTVVAAVAVAAVELLREVSAPEEGS